MPRWLELFAVGPDVEGEVLIQDTARFELTGAIIFADGFESADTSAWSMVRP